MSTHHPALSLFCVEQDRKYKLQLEGEDWSESFPSIEAAVLRAPALVSAETRMTVYGMDGVKLVVATIHPAMPEPQPSAG